MLLVDKYIDFAVKKKKKKKNAEGERGG